MSAQTLGRIGFIGAGMISDQYLTNLTQFAGIEVVIIGDLDLDRAAAQAAKYGVPQSGTPEQVLAHPDVDLIVNLTIPAAHAEVSLAAIEAGKHVWSEKPISVDLASGRELVARAAEKGLRVGIAPDTVLGQGVQSARRAIESGLIGTPIAANTSMQYNGPDIFHPNPEFLFAPGAGPVFDMGPYYVTTLVSIFGSVKKASAFGVRGRDTRTIKVGERAGTEFPVLVPTHVNALLEFENGGVSQSVFSWDSPLARVGLVEIIGTEGTLSIPDPNYFEGDILVTRAGEHQAGNEWEPVAAGGVVGGRGLGIVDLLEAARDGRPHRATGDMGLHVLEALIAIDASISSGQTVALDSTVARPAPVEADWNPYRGGAE